MLQVSASHVPALQSPSSPDFDGLSDIDATNIDVEVFRQILELDDDEADFAKEMCFAYFVQAEDTFNKIDEALVAKDLVELSSLGHYLKGSSAAIGVFKVSACCACIQYYGQLRDEASGEDLTPTDALGRIQTKSRQARVNYEEAKVSLTAWFKHREDSVD